MIVNLHPSPTLPAQGYRSRGHCRQGRELSFLFGFKAIEEVEYVSLTISFETSLQSLKFRFVNRKSKRLSCHVEDEMKSERNNKV